MSFLNFPASQAVHGPPSGPVVPAPHSNEQSKRLVLASGEAGLLAGQDKQFADPGASLYVPISHALHVPPSVPSKPALQVQAFKAELPRGASAFDGQDKHFVNVVAPPSREYVPEAQPVHAADPDDSLYLPATHAVHVPVPALPE